MTQADVRTRRKFAANMRLQAEATNDEPLYATCSRHLQQTQSPRLVYLLILIPTATLLWRFIETYVTVLPLLPTHALLPMQQ